MNRARGASVRVGYGSQRGHSLAERNISSPRIPRSSSERRLPDIVAPRRDKGTTSPGRPSLPSPLRHATAGAPADGSSLSGNPESSRATPPGSSPKTSRSLSTCRQGAVAFEEEKISPRSSPKSSPLSSPAGSPALRRGVVQHVRSPRVSGGIRSVATTNDSIHSPREARRLAPIGLITTTATNTTTTSHSSTSPLRTKHLSALHRTQMTHRRSNSLDAAPTQLDETAAAVPPRHGSEDTAPHIRSLNNMSAVSNKRGSLDGNATSIMSSECIRNVVQIQTAHSHMPERPADDGAGPALAAKACASRPAKKVVGFASTVTVLCRSDSNSNPNVRGFNTYADGHGVLKNREMAVLDAADSGQGGGDAIEDQALSSRRRTRGELSGVTAQLAAGGFTISHCDDPDDRDPIDAAREARERAVELRAELCGDE